MRKGNVVEVEISRCEGEAWRRSFDEVVTEEPLEIRLYYYSEGEIRRESISVTMRTPGNDFELAAGFLFTEGIIGRKEEIEGISYCTDVEEEQQFNIVNVRLRPFVNFDPKRLMRHFYTTSSCGVCGKASLEALRVRGCPTLPREGLRVEPRVVKALPSILRRTQRLFDRTGGLHAAGLFASNGRLLEIREDVGRHNALDKLIGAQLLKGELPLHNRILVVSGRTSFEMMQKALMAGIPMVIGVGAPSSLAVELAKEFGMTLVGFAKERGFNVYAGGWRIALGAEVLH